MPTLLLLLVAAASSMLAVVLWVRWRRAARSEYIRRYAFPPGLFHKLQQRRPQLALRDCELIARGLRQFFLAYLNSGCRFVSMPSQLADDLWHEMILYTKFYETFCRQAFGRFLHHTPAVVLGPDRRGNEGLRRTWWHSCREENINPRQPSRLPLLFALDAKFGIADGFRYAPDCDALRRGGDGSTHCGGDFSSSAHDGSTDGFGDSPGDGSDGGSGGDSGCGGGGCGGGGD
jgi:hypothetical protein